MIYFNHPPTLTEKVELDAAYRISHAEMRSTPRPMTWPCTAAITGNGARSGAATACWKASIFFRACKEVLALSLEPFVLSPSTLTSCTKHFDESHNCKMQRRPRTIQSGSKNRWKGR